MTSEQAKDVAMALSLGHVYLDYLEIVNEYGYFRGKAKMVAKNSVKILADLLTEHNLKADADGNTLMTFGDGKATQQVYELGTFVKNTIELNWKVSELDEEKQNEFFGEFDELLQEYGLRD